jgi:hypothetical protein
MTARWTIAGTDRIADLVELDLAAAAEAAAERRIHLAAEAGLPGIERGAHLIYLDEDGEHRGTFARIAEFGTGYGRRFRRSYLRVEITATGGQGVYIDPALVQRAAEPSLPACRRFAGTGRRCTTCKIHRNIHD